MNKFETDIIDVLRCHDYISTNSKLIQNIGIDINISETPSIRIIY